MHDPIPVTDAADSRPRFACRRCAAPLRWDPAQPAWPAPTVARSTKRRPRRSWTTRAARAEALRELDYHAYLTRVEGAEERVEVITTACTSCGAEVTLRPNITADDCPFCGSSLVRSGSSRRIIRPRAVLPFHVTVQQANDAYRRWLRGRWFAPNALKRQARREVAIHGVYVPHWTYDASTETDYSGERGVYYYVTVNYTTTENGRTVTRQRQERRTRWYPARGRVVNAFDDVLVPASDALPRSLCAALEPWDLGALVPYGDEYLSGFRAQNYTVELEGGFEIAKTIMAERIRQSVRRDIGGDDQRIHHLDTRYDDVTFKHILLPVWVSAYRYREKVYRFLVNARTGEVQGERPWSWLKIALAALLAITLAAGLLYLQDAR